LPSRSKSAPRFAKLFQGFLWPFWAISRRCKPEELSSIFSKSFFPFGVLPNNGTPRRAAGRPQTSKIQLSIISINQKEIPTRFSMYGRPPWREFRSVIHKSCKEAMAWRVRLQKRLPSVRVKRPWAQRAALNILDSKRRLHPKRFLYKYNRVSPAKAGIQSPPHVDSSGSRFRASVKLALYAFSRGCQGYPPDRIDRMSPIFVSAEPRLRPSHDQRKPCAGVFDKDEVEFAAIITCGAPRQT